MRKLELDNEPQLVHCVLPEGIYPSGTARVCPYVKASVSCRLAHAGGLGILLHSFDA
jgi:hypothetical protein